MPKSSLGFPVSPVSSISPKRPGPFIGFYFFIFNKLYRFFLGYKAMRVLIPQAESKYKIPNIYENP